MTMMTEIERLDYLVRTVGGGNARNFAQKAGIRPDSLSKVRNGRGNPSFYFQRILVAFPDVREAWLYSGKGEPFHSTREKGEVMRKIEALEKEVRRLAGLIEKMTR